MLGSGSNPAMVNGIPVLSTHIYAGESTDQIVFNVTGDVILRIIPVCKTAFTPGEILISLGITSDPDKFILDTPIDNLVAGQIWIDATPDSKAEPESNALDFIISDSENVVIGIPLAVATGVIHFYGFWIPLSADANVTPHNLLGT